MIRGWGPDHMVGGDRSLTARGEKRKAGQGSPLAVVRLPRARLVKSSTACAYAQACVP
jgi:hypothetical protein